ncbi:MULTISPECIES: Rv3235 family protein [unclassified Pseudofrankia]|uniref:Rv3235 family protein n=1 Tax=unclassified Pseudofrankia TaxID=2994372 RepID=UPI0008DACDAD|nr:MULTISPECIES: Rv3235 family protein [unclassified Pseudofrankia]MDT3438996.1 Rv3235 family protein [Pseudofrankia sp. BMG5.37]OHV50600.1 hypothetical protein BCD48_01095 [Pseudofrankia sp. BMG5.36]
MTLPNAHARQPDVPEPPSPAALRGHPAFMTEPPYDDEAQSARHDEARSVRENAARNTGDGDGDAARDTRDEKPRGAGADKPRCAGDGEAPRAHAGRRTLQTGGRRGPGTAGSSHGRGARHGAAAHRGPGDVRLPPPPSPAATGSRGHSRATDDVSLRTVSGRPNVTAHPAARHAPLRIPPQVRDSRFLESPAPAATIVVRAIVEVLSGVRPVSHLAGWATPRLQAALEKLGGRYPGRGSVRSIRIGEPRPGVAEIVAVVNRGDRVAALALRMESAGGRWQVTSLQIG